MKQQLRRLTCFNNIETIVPIATGLSSHCFQVSADNQTFFAKRLTTKNEALVCFAAANESISPRVIYHDHHWLVTEFIAAENLTFSAQTNDEKADIAIELMAQCHQLTAKPPQLSPQNVIDSLIKNTAISRVQRDELLTIANQVTPELRVAKKLVCCHGDINFSNILINLENRAFIVDFECACSAPAEYDIAMFIAVNNLAKDSIPDIVGYYQKHTLEKIDLPLLNHYLVFCYFINGLWYLQADRETGQAKFNLLAKQQWQNIQTLNLSLFFQ